MMDIDGLGERYIDSLVEFELVRGVAGLYRAGPGQTAGMKRRADERDNWVRRKRSRPARWPPSGRIIY